MKDRLKVGVIGIGFVGEKYLKIISNDPLAELIAIADSDETRMNRFGEIYNCAAYSDYRMLLQRDEIQAVFICLPEHLHKEAAVFAAGKNKHILLEKPIATNVADAQLIKKACESNNVRLMIAHVLMFDPRYVSLYNQKNSGLLGDISHIFMRRQNTVRAARRFKGSLSFMHYLGIHDVAWMLLLADSKPKTIYSCSNDVINKSNNDYDNIYTTVEFENGAVGSLFIGWSLPDSASITMLDRLEVVGSKGMGVIDSANSGYYLTTNDDVNYIDTVHWPEFNGQIHGDLHYAVSHFIKSTIYGTPYMVDTDNAIEAVRLVDHILLSNETKCPVKYSF